MSRYDDDRYGGTVQDDDRDEARTERYRAEKLDLPHPLDCRCSRACLLEASGMSEAEARGPAR